MHLTPQVSNAQMRLRLDGLQSAMALHKGNIYVIAEEDDRLADALLWGTLIDACEEDGSACLVSATRTAYSLNQSGLGAEARNLLAARRLFVLEALGAMVDGTIDEAADGRAGHASPVPRRAAGARQQQIMKDLRHWNTDRTRLLVIDGAEQLFPHPDGIILAKWREWAEHRDVAVLLMFRQSGMNGNDVMSLLAPHAHLYAGMARIKSKYGVATWEVFHWFCETGLMAGKSFPLHLGSERRLEVPREEESAASGIELAADETRILALRSAFLPKEPPPGGWLMADGQAEDMLARLSGAVASTIVLSFSSSTDFISLVRCVFELRKQCGPRLKIVIREIHARLRYGQETLAVRLGANLVVPAEISYARFLSLTSMVQGQVFRQQLPATFEQAISDAMPEDAQGYLPPHDFSQAVATTLERSRMLHVQNVLLRLPLAYGLLPLDALRYCNIKRAGDFCTADHRNVYLFLYACRESDIDKALERLFGLPVSEIFSSEERFMSAHRIRNAMTDFDARLEAEKFPDLTNELAALTSARTAARPAETPAAVKKGPAVLRYPAPPPAVQRPLPVKGSPALIEVSALTS